MKKLFTLLSVACVLFAGCSSDNTEDLPPKPELAISSDNAGVTIDADGLGAAIAVDANGLITTLDIATNLDVWTLSEQIPSWIKVAHSGKGITVTVTKNEDLKSRNTVVTVWVENQTGKLEADIRISQTGVAPATLTLADQNLAIPSAGGSAVLTYTSNQTAIDVKTTAKWLHFTQGDGKITFTAEANDTNSPLTAEVVITAGAGDNIATDRVVISQDVHKTLVLSTKNLTIPAAGGTAVLTYTSNQTTIAVQETAGWLEFTKGEGTITFNSAANSTGAPLTAQVMITAGTGSDAAIETVTVSQDPLVKSLIYVVKTTTAGQQVGLPVLTSKDESISISVDYGDGSTAENFTTSVTAANKHAFATAGEYTVTINSNNAISAFSFSANTYLCKIKNNSLDMSAITTLARCFYNCTGLSEVAVNTLTPCVNVTDVETIFYNCKSLTGIPSGLLTGLNKITKFNNMFQKCSSLSSVPSGLFEGRTNVKSFYGVFNGTALTEVPSRCFAGCTAVTEFKNTFYGCNSLKTISLDAFEGCTDVTDFYAVFTDCKALTEIPAALFAKMTQLSYIEYTFQGCSALKSLPASLFDNNRRLSSLDYAFQNCTSLTGESPNTTIRGTKVHLYERASNPDDFLAPSSYGGCFGNDEGLSDYAALSQANWAN